MVGITEVGKIFYTEWVHIIIIDIMHYMRNEKKKICLNAEYNMRLNSYTGAFTVAK